MNLDHLKVFSIAAHKKNFSETGKILHLSQPTVSSQIRQLEESLGTTLFVRSAKKVELTAEGELLLKYTEKILNLVNRTEKEIALLSESIHGDLVIGASLTIGEHVLPFVLGKFKKQFPQIRLTMKIYNSEQIIEKLKNEEIHLGFIESMVSYPRFQQESFLDDELVVIASHDALFAGKHEITEQELFEWPIILREKGSGTRQVVEEHLRQHDLDPGKLNIILELEHTEAIKSAVESGMGISILSKSAIQKELQLNILRQLKVRGIEMKRHFYSVYDQNKLTLPSESFLTFIHSYYRKAGNS